ncbi:unnamed protein product [Linum trigynum]|uniref:Uncharacterized protein n=1 Tax=Linum trigynum TaxID=586398 RepID=A0AAV2DSY4_9ROSI
MPQESDVVGKMRSNSPNSNYPFEVGIRSTKGNPLTINEHFGLVVKLLLAQSPSSTPVTAGEGARAKWAVWKVVVARSVGSALGIVLLCSAATLWDLHLMWWVRRR